jgi:hypothetical protein
MTERERWIVYPLLFFALGASLRDKFMQQVSTKELVCRRIDCEGPIACEGVVVLDPNNKSQPHVQLGRVEPAEGAAGQPPTRFGVLILRDSNGKELCGVTNNELFVRTISCEGLKVVDPANPTRAIAAFLQNGITLWDADNPARVLAGLWSAVVRTDKPDAKPQRIGVLALNNRQIQTVQGSPAPPQPDRPQPDEPQR